MRWFYSVFFWGVLITAPATLLAQNSLVVESLATRPPSRASEFQTPPRLRGRVNFWKSIFTQYGKNQVVIHHRDYPQVVYKVLDFSAVSEAMAPIGAEKYRKKIVDDRISEVKQSLLSLSRGSPPANKLEEQIVESMRFMPGGTAKYRDAVEKDLVRSQTGIKERYAEAVKRAGRYLPIMEAIFVNEYRLPRELTRLPFIESSFDYMAYSSVGAAGIWQFMPKTGRTYMTINNLVDERRDPIEATRAAARYLSSAYTRLGTWPLSITSYNHGVAGIFRKVQAVGTTDISSIIEDPDKRVLGFASNNFFPEFLAALEVYDNYHDYFPNLVLESPLNIAQMRLNQPLSIGHISRELGVSVEDLKRVNYGISSAIWNGRYRVPAGYTLKVPAEYAPKLSLLKQGEAVAKVLVTQVSPSGGMYRVRKGDTVSSVAKKSGLSVAKLRELNNLEGDSLVIGQSLKVKFDEKPKIAIKPTVVKAKPTPQKITKKSPPKQEHYKLYKVMPGDTIWGVSQKLGVSAVDLRAKNKLKGSKLKAGSTLKIP